MHVPEQKIDAKNEYFDSSSVDISDCSDQLQSPDQQQCVTDALLAGGENLESCTDVFSGLTDPNVCSQKVIFSSFIPICYTGQCSASL